MPQQTHPKGQPARALTYQEQFHSTPPKPKPREKRKGLIRRIKDYLLRDTYTPGAPTTPPVNDTPTSYKTKTKEYKTEIQRLRQKLDEAESEREAAYNERDKVRAERDDAQARAGEAERKKDIAYRENENALERAREAYEERDAIRQSYDKDTSSYKETLSVMEQQVDDLSAQNRELREGLEYMMQAGHEGTRQHERRINCPEKPPENLFEMVSLLEPQLKTIAEKARMEKIEELLKSDRPAPQKSGKGYDG
ncbi:MAG: hypothetical protein R6U32_06850 [Candidatus Woesearchaeota archaeon]